MPRLLLDAFITSGINKVASCMSVSQATVCVDAQYVQNVLSCFSIYAPPVCLFVFVCLSLSVEI